MGRLAGFTYADVAAKLRRAGFKFDRRAKGSHEIWRNPVNRRRTMVPHGRGIYRRARYARLLNRPDCP